MALQFEARKIALKQDRTGYVLTLSIHPDEVPDDILRDFVGSRYHVVMVRLNGEDKPMTSNQFDIVRSAGILCRDHEFHKFLEDANQIMEPTEKEATDWLKSELGIQSRTELKTNQAAASKYSFIYQEFQQWKNLKN